MAIIFALQATLIMGLISFLGKLRDSGFLNFCQAAVVATKNNLIREWSEMLPEQRKFYEPSAQHKECVDVVICYFKQSCWQARLDLIFQCKNLQLRSCAVCTTKLLSDIFECEDFLLEIQPVNLPGCLAGKDTRRPCAVFQGQRDVNGIPANYVLER